MSMTYAAISPRSYWNTSGLSETFSSQKEQDIAFYKSKTSPFPSGHTTLERLKEKILLADFSDEYQLTQNQNHYSPQDLKYTTAFHLSRVWVEKYTQRKVEPKYDQPLDEIILNYETDPFDRGLIQVINTTQLKIEPQIKAQKILTIPEKTRLIPISFEKGFVKVLYQKKFGYIDINDCISKFDFVKFAISFQSKTNTWETIERRDFDSLITREQKTIHLSHLKAFLVNEKIAITIENDKKLPKWSLLQIQKKSVTSWIQSELKGHGAIWWKKNKFEAKNQNTLSIDDLLKKDISSVSLDSTNPKKGLISSHGVYISQDGQNWKEIPQFKGFSGPVYYFNESIFFVGNFKTLNGGKTFENYIQVEKVSEAIKKTTGYIPKKIKITKIKMQKPISVVIEVHTGFSAVKLKSPLFAQDWKPLR